MILNLTMNKQISLIREILFQFQALNVRKKSILGGKCK